jgi:hypothetical protein
MAMAMGAASTNKALLGFSMNSSTRFSITLLLYNSSRNSARTIAVAPQILWRLKE